MLWWNQIKQLKQEKLSLEKNLDEMKKRVYDIENAIEKEYGVRIRQEITNINVIFTKIELVIILAAIDKYMKNSSVADIEFSLALRKKIMDFIDNVKED